MSKIESAYFLEFGDSEGVIRRYCPIVANQLILNKPNFSALLRRYDENFFTFNFCMRIGRNFHTLRRCHAWLFYFCASGWCWRNTGLRREGLTPDETE